METKPTGSDSTSSSPSKEIKEDRSKFVMRVSTAAFYGLASFLIMVINKRVLTVHHFPSFQGGIVDMKIYTFKKI